MVKKSWKELVISRLEVIRRAVDKNVHYTDILNELRSEGLVSEYYDVTCLTVDVWFLFDKRPVYTHRKIARIGTIKDPVIRLFLGVLVRAIQDARSRRPCDVNSWAKDCPPDRAICLPSEHICEDHATEFLDDSSIFWEDILNLPYGTLLGIATKENGSVKSRSPQIFNCIGSEDQ